MGRAAKGRSIANLLELRSDEKIAATIRVQSKKSGTGANTVDQTWDENFHIVFATRTGIVKKSNLSDYSNVRKGGIIAIQIEQGDRLIDAKLTNGNNEIVLITKEGMSLRFHEEQLRDQGRNTVGVGAFGRRKATWSWRSRSLIQTPCFWLQARTASANERRLMITGGNRAAAKASSR